MPWSFAITSLKKISFFVILIAFPPFTLQFIYFFFFSLSFFNEFFFLYFSPFCHLFLFFSFFFLILSPFPSKQKIQFEKKKKKHSQCVDGRNTKQLQVFIKLNKMQ
jgi:hypothetical protein